jgi:hypothetical protein
METNGFITESRYFRVCALGGRSLLAASATSGAHTERKIEEQIEKLLHGISKEIT